MNARRTCLALFAVLAAGYLLWWLFPDTAMGGLEAPPTMLDEQPRRSAEVPNGPPVLDRVASPIGSLMFRVRDERSEILEGVHVLRQPGQRRHVASADAIGITDRQGQLTLSKETVVPGMRLSFSKVGFLVASQEISDRSAYEIVLQRGTELRFEIADGHQQPVVGAFVVVSGRPLPAIDDIVSLGHADANVHPASEDRGVLQVATSGQDGVAVVSGLQPGPVHFAIQKRGYLRYGVAPYPTHVPCASIRVTMLPIYVAAWKVVGDTVLDSFVSHPKGADVTVSGWLDATAEEVRRGLGADGCRAIVTRRSVDEALLLDRTATVRVLLERTGFMSFEVPMQRLTTTTDCVYFDATQRREAPGTRVALTVLNANGRQLPVDEFFHLLAIPIDEPRATRFGILLTSATQPRLPRGNYRLDSGSGEISAFLPKDQIITVQGQSQDVQVRLTGNLVPVRVRMEDATGIPFQFGDYQVRYPEAKSSIVGMVKDRWPSRTFWWPEGRVALDLKSDKAKASLADIVLAAPPSGLFEIVARADS